MIGLVLRVGSPNYLNSYTNIFFQVILDFHPMQNSEVQENVHGYQVD
jgi:hypothetical protein